MKKPENKEPRQNEKQRSWFDPFGEKTGSFFLWLYIKDILKINRDEARKN